MTHYYDYWSDAPKRAVFLGSSTYGDVEKQQISPRLGSDRVALKGAMGRVFVWKKPIGEIGPDASVTPDTVSFKLVLGEKISIPKGPRPPETHFATVLDVSPKGASDYFIDLLPPARSTKRLANLSLLVENRRRVRNRTQSIIASSEWGRPCKNLFFDLAFKQSPELIELIQSGHLEDTHLTYALEALGEFEDPHQVRNVLMPFLKHPKPYVREGAVYGLGRHMVNPEILGILRKQLVLETSPGVKEAIEEILEGDATEQ